MNLKDFNLQYLSACGDLSIHEDVSVVVETIKGGIEMKIDVDRVVYDGRYKQLIIITK